MKIREAIQLLCLFFGLGHTFFFVPEEVPQLANIIMSLIPPIKFGIQNTKVGYGFRIGRNADFQVLFELGPQYSTTPPSSSAKRETSHSFDRRANFMAKLLEKRPAAAPPKTAPVNATRLEIGEETLYTLMKRVAKEKKNDVSVNENEI